MPPEAACDYVKMLFFTKTLTGRGFIQAPRQPRTRSKPMSSVQSWRERLYMII